MGREEREANFSRLRGSAVSSSFAGAACQKAKIQGEKEKPRASLAPYARPDPWTKAPGTAAAEKDTRRCGARDPRVRDAGGPPVAAATPPALLRLWPAATQHLAGPPSGRAFSCALRFGPSWPAPATKVEWWGGCRGDSGRTGEAGPRSEARGAVGAAATDEISFLVSNEHVSSAFASLSSASLLSVVVLFGMWCKCWTKNLPVHRGCLGGWEVGQVEKGVWVRRQEVGCSWGFLEARGEVTFRAWRSGNCWKRGDKDLRSGEAFRNRYLRPVMGNVGVAGCFYFEGKCLLGAVI